MKIAHLTTTDLTLRYLLLGQLRRLAAEGHEVTGISAPGPHAAALEAAGIRFLPWRNATRSWDPVADARAHLAEDVAQRAWQEGLTMSLPEAVARAQGDTVG
jgi:hypothetical protein